MGINARQAKIRLFDRSITVAEHREFGSLVEEIAQGARQRVFFCNVHMLMLSREDQALSTAMDNANWVFADGVPVAWLQRRVGDRPAQVIRGYELMLAVCDRAARLGEPIGLFGSTDGVLSNLERVLRQRYPGLIIAFTQAPPYAQEPMETSIEELCDMRNSGITWLFVGLGCPKQEKWIERHASQLDCHLLGVGAAFDWLSGGTKKPPNWMEGSGLGWLYRLAQDPRKMWRRYFVFNTKFVVQCVALIFRGTARSDSNGNSKP